jgi:hypothetical protein
MPDTESRERPRIKTNGARTNGSATVEPPANVRSMEEHVARITESWRGSVEKVIETCIRVVEAKEELEHGKFLAMIRTKLPFGERTAQMLMHVGNHPTMTTNTGYGRKPNPKFISYLPPSWATLHELSRIPAERLERLIHAGTITCETKGTEVRAIIESYTGEYGSALDGLQALVDFMHRTPQREQEAGGSGWLLELDDALRRKKGFLARGCWEGLPELAQWLGELNGKITQAKEAVELDGRGDRQTELVDL